MSKKNQPANKNSEFLDQQKLIHFQTVFQAFIETRLEVDKQLLGISTAAIGLLITVQDKLVAPGWSKNCFYISIGSFLFTVFMVMNILKQNSDYLAAEHGDHAKADKINKVLRLKDTVASILFLAGIVTAVLTMIFKMEG